MDPRASVGHRLPRRVSLKHRKWIRALFDRSQPGAASVASGCIRVVFRLVSDVSKWEHGRVFVGFSPGPKIRGAVKRNRVKRLLRESYRFEQAHVMRACAGTRYALTLMVVYRSGELLAISQIRSDMAKAIASMIAKLNL